VTKRNSSLGIGALGAACLATPGCTFAGSGIVPSGPAPAPVVAERLEVPYVQTPRPVVAAMLDLARVGPPDYLIDLGSGDGRIPIAAAQRGARALGVDIDPRRIDEAVAAARFAQVETRALFRRQDLFATPLRDASVVTLYLLPEINMRLRPRLLTELRPGARVVSHNFLLGDWEPDARREIESSRIYLWVVPATVAGEWIFAADGTELPLSLEQRFQRVTGMLGARPLRDVALEGTRLRFTVDMPGGPLTYRGLVGDRVIVPDPQASEPAPAGWQARRLD
jgi:SAM-dependent methyltransferase